MSTLKLKIVVGAVVLAIISLALGVVIGKMSDVWLPKEQTTLEEPLLIHSPNGEVGWLPSNTVLRFESSYPEGFTRYIVYVNVKGFNLPNPTLTKRNMKSPVSNVNKEDFLGPSRIDTLKQIFGTLEITDQDLREVLANR